MLISTRDYLSVVAPYIPLEIVSAETVDVISNLAAALPPSSNFGLECKLGSPAPHADFLFAVIPSDGSLSAWAGENPLTALPQAVRIQPSWRKVQGFLADWHADAVDFEPVHDTWLELDIDPHRPTLPEPSFFFGFDDSVAVNYPDLVETLVERLLGSPLADHRREALRWCFSRLPPQGIVFQVGVMLSRGADEVRLCTRRMTPQEITGYLARVGFPGSVAPLSRYLDALAPMVDAISVDISLGESVLPQIGLECSIRDGAAGRARMASLLEHLVANSACLPEKANALFRWLGYCTEVADRPRWPAHLLKASTALGDGVYGAFARTLNHVKITYQAGEPIAAKAYLGVRHLWCRVSS